MMTNKNDLRISDKMTQIVIKGMQEFIGQDDLVALIVRSGLVRLPNDDLLKLAVSNLRYADLSALQQALEDFYTLQGARGVALRSGRAAFGYFIKEFGDEAGFNELDFRLMPLRRRMLAGLECLAGIIGREVGQTICVEQIERAWTWQIEICPECWGRSSQTPVCTFTVGLLQEFMCWLSGGKIYLVEETACRAKGDPVCLIRIDQKPLD